MAIHVQVGHVVKEVPAHEQRITLHIIEAYPEHGPRESDPHYKYFNQARHRLAGLGKLKCWIGNADCAGGIELHHSTVEFALANGVDIGHFQELYPEFGVHSDEEFLAWVEGEGNLTPLCVNHHRSMLGIHSIPYPLWLPQRFWKEGIPVPGRIAQGSELAKVC